MKNISLRQLTKRKKEILLLFVTKLPPEEYFLSERVLDLQDFICSNLKSQLSYATGDSIIEAMVMISESQFENGLEKLR